MLPHPKQAHGCWRRPQAALGLPSGCHYLRRVLLPPVPCAEQTAQPEASCSSPRGGSGHRQRAGEVGKEEGKRLAFIKSRKFIS